jgi:hypothetical protein
VETMDPKTPAATKTSRLFGSIGLALVAAALALYLLYLSERGAPLNDAIYHASWVGGLLSLLAATVIRLFILRRGHWISRAEQVLYYSLIMLPILLGSLLVLNARTDSSEPVGHVAVVIQKGAGCWPLGLGCSYTVEVSSWREHLGIERLDVGKEAFNKLEPHQPVIVITREGRLGLAWIEEVKTLNQEQLNQLLLKCADGCPEGTRL